MSTSSKLVFIFILITGLLSCASEEECPIENANGTYSGTYVEKYLYDEEDIETVESVEVLLTNITDDGATIMLGELSDDLVFHVNTDGCSFSSKHLFERGLPEYILEGSFENDKLYLELKNPISFPDDEDDMYDLLEELAESGKLEGASGEELINLLNGLEGFSGFEEFEALKSIEQLDDMDAIEDLLEIIEFTAELAEYLRFDFSKI